MIDILQDNNIHVDICASENERIFFKKLKAGMYSLQCGDIMHGTIPECLQLFTVEFACSPIACVAFSSKVHNCDC